MKKTKAENSKENHLSQNAGITSFLKRTIGKLACKEGSDGKLDEGKKHRESGFMEARQKKGT